MALLKCENLTVGYEGIPVIRDLSFQIEKGNYLCIIGENGSGKTTLMKTILGFLKPSSGTITYGDGLDRTKIGYLPQQTMIQKDFPATVEEVVLSGCLNHLGRRMFYGAKERALAKKHMEDLNISSIAAKSYRELSGGQQQRVLLARALCAADGMLLLDEPVTGLDPETARDMYALIHSLNKKGQTIIMISHDVEEVNRYASHILSFDRKTFFATKEEYQKGQVNKDESD